VNVTRSRTRLAALTLGAVIGLGGLSGCGGLHPGVAVEVGDTSISNSEADSLSRDLCRVVSANPEQSSGGPIARSRALAAVVQLFVMRTIAEQMGSHYGVEPSATYDATVSQAKQQLSYLKADERARVLDLLLATNYFDDVVGAIGKQTLVTEGVATPSAEDAAARGFALAQDWEAGHQVSVNPRFPQVNLTDAQFALTVTNTAFPLTSFAKQAASTEPSAKWVGALPASQRCG
jgi:hypothetical protein